MSNVDKLKDAGLLDPTNVTQDEKDVINALTTTEVDSLISVHSKLSKKGTMDGPGGCF